MKCAVSVCRNSDAVMKAVSMPSRVTISTTKAKTPSQAAPPECVAAASRRVPMSRRRCLAAFSMYTTMEMTRTAATRESRASHFGSTAASASHVPSTTEMATEAAVPQPTAESRASRPVCRRYVAAMATMRNISIPSRSVTSSIWPISNLLRREDQLVVLSQAQPVLPPVVDDDQFAIGSEQRSAGDLLGRFLRLANSRFLFCIRTPVDNNDNCYHYRCQRHIPPDGLVHQ